VPRLRRADTSGPGLRRVGAGRGFTYRGIDGGRADAATRARIEGLVIPPAWSDVWICPYDNGHIQATGLDAAGRRQYLYHPAWREQKDRIKFERALELAKSLPGARRKVTADLRSSGFTRERALAAGFRMLDTALLRVGSERYAQEHGSHGLSTLLCSHATVTGADAVLLAFPGKSGQPWSSELRDPDLAEFIRALKRRGPTARLLAWKGEGGWHPVSAAEINEYVRERTGGDFTAKDFRTLHATVAAAEALSKAGPRPSASARRRVVAATVRQVATLLGNTPAIARGSYIDSRIIDLYDHGRTIERGRPGAAERALVRLLAP
jgi:DNA topoisomerase-1